MNSIVKVFSNFKEFYSEINGATLTGAIDVIVVEQPDGSYNCSPFHVRFGKLGVLRSREKVVDIEVNGDPVDIHMKLGESGEAFFVQECAEDDLEILPEHMATSPIPTDSFNNYNDTLQNTNEELQFQNVQYVRPRRNSVDLSSEATENDRTKYENQESDFNQRRHTDETTGRPDLTKNIKEYTTQQIRMEWGEQDPIFQNEINGEAVDGPNEWKNSASLVTEECETEKTFRPINQDEAEAELEKTVVETKEVVEIVEEKIVKEDSKSKKKRRRKSIMKKKNSQRKGSTSSSAGSTVSEQNEIETDSMTVSNITVSSSSSDSPKLDEVVIVSETKIVESVKEHAETQTITSSRPAELDIHFFSDTEVAHGTSPRQSRPSTPVQSDTEFEMSQRDNKPDDGTVAASWKWGELPTKGDEKENINTPEGKQAERNSMLSGLMSFMKYNNKKMKKEGLYLADLEADGIDPEVAALYFPQRSDRANQVNRDDDRESGNGTSLPQSPVSIEGSKMMDSDFYGYKNVEKNVCDFITMSNCGGLDKFGGPTEDEFQKGRIRYEDVCNDPVLFSSPNMVVRMNNKYYSWAAACPQIMTMLAFQKQLPEDAVDKLVTKTIADGIVIQVEPSSPEQKPTEQEPQKQVEQRRGWWGWGRRSADKAQASPTDKPKSAVATQTSRSTSPDENTTSISITTKTNNKEDGYNGSMSSEDSDTMPGDSNKMSQQSQTHLSALKALNEKYRKSLRLTTKQIEMLNLNDGVNEVVFSVTTAYQGTTRCKCYLFKWKHNDKVVISDIDGTITKSDVLGHILPMVGKNWEQIGVAHLFSKIEENGYKMLYLSARAIGQAQTTRDYLQSIRQGDVKLPDGPLLLNPTSLMSALHREVIEKKPEQFKIACLSDIQTLFPEKNPFYAGYGNRINDVWAYRAVGIPIMRIFTINTKGELKHELTQTFQSTYFGQSLVVNDIFPPIVCDDVFGNGDDDCDSCFNDDDVDDDIDYAKNYPHQLQFSCDVEY